MSTALLNGTKLDSCRIETRTEGIFSKTAFLFLFIKSGVILKQIFSKGNHSNVASLYGSDLENS